VTYGGKAGSVDTKGETSIILFLVSQRSTCGEQPLAALDEASTLKSARAVHCR